MPDLKLEGAARSDTGRVRSHNEDSVLELTLGQRPDRAELWFFAVADGVGGGPGGELASRAAIESLRAGLVAREAGAVSDALRQVMTDANAAVYDLRRGFDGERPGSTLVAAVVQDGALWVANVGDSRAYLCRGNRCEQLSVDHSLERDMLATTSARRARKYRHVITRSLGIVESVDTDVFGPRQLRTGDVVVLCSDGLYGPVEDREIARCTLTMSPSDAANRLVELANERGGHDNISVVIVQVAG